MAELTNEELLNRCIATERNLLRMDYAKREPDPPTLSTRDHCRAAVLARMSPGWQPIPEGPERSKLGNVLIAAMYPDGRTMSDVYHDWWTFGGWARWRHPFPPTHYMIIQPLPEPPR